MKLPIPRYFTRLLILILVLVSGKLYASHIVGLELYYTYVSGNTYTITLVAYGDCGPASAGAFASLPTSSPAICIYDGNTAISNISLTVQDPALGVEITPVCPSDSLLTQCRNTANPIPGIKKFVYSGNYTVPYTSANWRFLFEGDMCCMNVAGRAAAITNIIPGTNIQLIDTLNNTVYNNSNPIMTTVPTPFFCLNNNDTYNPGAVDPDGDSLSFFLVPGINGTDNCGAAGVPVTYTGAFTGQAPLDAVPGSFTFDQHTGQISFFPGVLQRALVVYNVEEYRHGAFVGSCQREMTFLVLTCTDLPPIGFLSGATAGTVADSTHYNICKDSGLYTIFINPLTADTTNTITVTASGLPAGSVFNVVNNGTNHPNCTFSWTSTGITPGSYIFYLTFKDNACPLSGTQTRAFTVTVLPLPPVHAVGGFRTCLDAAVNLTATGALTYSWSPTTGLACPLCSITPANNPRSALYTVTGIDGSGCRNTDTASVLVYPAPPGSILHDMTANQVINYGSSIQLSVQGAWIYYWKPDDGSLNDQNINNPIATPLKNTTYTVYAYNREGCIDTAQVSVDVATTAEVIPTAFTPNDDGVNDVFRVTNLRYGHLIAMRIYNRWGQLVCETTDNEKGWDGKFQGVQQGLGVYNYYIIVEREDGKTVNYKGDLTLIR